MDKTNLLKEIDVVLDELKRSPSPLKDVAREFLTQVSFQVNNLEVNAGYFSYIYREMQNCLKEFRRRLSNNAAVSEDFQNLISGMSLSLYGLSKFDASPVIEEINKYREESKISYETLKKHLRSTEKLANLVAENALKNGFNETAKKEGSDANFFRRCTITTLCVAVVVSTLMLVAMLYHPVLNSWEAVSCKVAIVALLLILAFYFSGESHLHRGSQQSNRKMALDLDAIEPFLAGMNAGAAEKIKESLAMKMFGMSGFVMDADRKDDALIKFILSKVLDKKML